MSSGVYWLPVQLYVQCNLAKTDEKFLLIPEPLKFHPYLFPHLIFVGDIGTMTIFLAVLFVFSFAGNALGIGL